MKARMAGLLGVVAAVMVTAAAVFLWFPGRWLAPPKPPVYQVYVTSRCGSTFDLTVEGRGEKTYRVGPGTRVHVARTTAPELIQIHATGHSRLGDYNRSIKSDYDDFTRNFTVSCGNRFVDHVDDILVVLQLVASAIGDDS